MKNDMTRNEKATITKNRLYIKAIDLIREKGYVNVLIEDITQSAGVAKGTFYYYFDSKEQILTYTFKYLDNHYKNALILAKKQSTYHAMIETFIRESYENIEKTGKEIGIAINTNICKNEIKEAFLDKNRNLYKALEYIFQIGIKNGYISDRHDQSFYIEKTIIMLWGIEYYWVLLPADQRKLPDIAMECVDSLLHGFTDDKCDSFHQPFA